MMKLSTLTAALRGPHLFGDDTIEITGVTQDSRGVQHGDMFVAVRGVHVDGHRFISHAIENGASAVLFSDPKCRPKGITSVRVKDTRHALAAIADTLNEHPSGDFTVVGITGTNGKTTTSFLLEAIWRAAGKKSGVVGTIEYRIGDEHTPASLTTPEAPDLQRIFSKMRDANVDSVVMEVSSHALQLQRVVGIDFNCAIFTNLTQDHLDFHETMAAYGEVKKQLFSKFLKPGRPAVINLDDDFGRKLSTTIADGLWTYSLDPDFEPSIYPTDLQIGTDGMTVSLHTPNGPLKIDSTLVGRFNVSNIMAAVAAAQALGVDNASIINGIEGLAHVPGRVQSIPNELGLSVLVDYAHTPDALERVLTNMRQLTENRLICVFGCGGDRDRSKRSIMGRVAVTNADLSIVTSDNPRTEDPDTIIAEIIVDFEELGVMRRSIEGARTADGYVLETDRRNAIWMAIGFAEPGDIVVIAGKGHEDYQILGKEYFHFDDCEEASNAIIEKKRFIEATIERKNKQERP